MTTGLDIARAARLLVGTPTRHRGRSPRIELDCVGVLWCAAALCGVTMMDFRDYGLPPDPAVLLREVARACEHAAPQVGAAAVFVWTPGIPLHVGILTEIGADGAWRMVHAGKRDVREVPFHPERLHSSWRIRGVS